MACASTLKSSTSKNEHITPTQIGDTLAIAGQLGRKYTSMTVAWRAADIVSLTKHTMG